ncbi:MAG: AlpA family phage regulatory protein [Steroidobacteraceae bacterium]
MRLPEVTARTGLSRSSVYRKMTEGSFPEPVVLGPLNAAA